MKQRLAGFREWVARKIAPVFIRDLEDQIDSLQLQVRHAAKATDQMGQHSRAAEMQTAWARLAQQQERERNRNLPGYVPLRDDQAHLLSAKENRLIKARERKNKPAISK